MVNAYWTTQQKEDGTINNKTKERVLGEGWETDLRNESSQEEINKKRDNLKNLIDKAKLNQQQNAYTALLSTIQSAISLKELNDLTDSINSFDYTNLPPKRNDNFLRKSQQKRQKKNWKQ